MDKIHKNGRGGNKFGDPKLGQKKGRFHEMMTTCLCIEVHAT